ncbi:MAG: bifunctional phosphopantothenoylcysteine decarboxylase/phosphopantothenate--cysteine ligase CoaBC [Candidatus ainarchaeum sp.]|nr:bifunctional phosphopantothenoylcysteine decarboxylase/phosphopantothenate--cysteine ligase CoaBC [Candidatus ainarchaeum sp.]
MHSSKSITGSSGRALSGKKICLCVTGSVAAARSADLARELMRNGAEVHCVMSGSAQRLVGAELLHWATGNPVVTALSGDCEHVNLCGEAGGKADLLVVAPCTANTLGKIANGIDDTTVTTFASTALGSSTPVILVPAMHASIYQNPFVSENVGKLRERGVTVMQPELCEGKAKFPDVRDVALECARALSRLPLKGKRVLVTAGATREFFDDVRFISNPGTGRMGAALAAEAYAQGADVTLVAGHLEVRVPGQISVVKAESAQRMLSEVRARAKKSDAVILAASVGDFTAKKSAGKTPSLAGFGLGLSPAPKISDKVKGWNPRAKLVLFKAESGVGDAELIRKAKEKMASCRADAVVANDVSREGAGFAVDTNEVIVITKGGGQAKLSGRKSGIARLVIRSVLVP